MSGRAATTDVIEGKYALAVGIPDKPLAPGWSWHRLTDVAEMATGHTPSRNHPEYWDGEIAWIGIKDAREFHGRRITSTFQTVTQAGIDNSASVLLPKNTVCLSRTASVGYVTIMDRSMATSQDFVNWKCSPALVPEFLMYLLIAERDSLFKFGKGTTHTTIYFPEAKALAAGLPPAGEQRRIVAKIEELFSDLDAGVAALERVRANLKRYRAAVLKSAVEGRLTEEWRKRNPVAPEDTAAKLLERILFGRRAKWEQDQLRKFKEAGKTPPKGWKEKYEEPLTPSADEVGAVPPSCSVATIDQLSHFVTSGSRGWAEHYSEDGPLFIRAQDINSDRLRLDRVAHVQPPAGAEVARTRTALGDLLVTVTGANVTKTGFVEQELGDAYVSQHVAMVRLVLPAGVRYVHMWVVCPAHGRRTLEKLAYGAGKPGLNLEQVRSLSVWLPPLAEQSAIVAEVDRRLSVADAAEQQVEHALQRAARLRQSILKRAFEGRLVPQDSPDEPAAKMLDRASAAKNDHRAVIQTSSTPGRSTPKRRSRARA